MAGITEANLMDTAGNPVSTAVGGLANTFANVSFTTNGGADLSATAPVVTIAAPRGTMNENEATVVLNWPAIAGAGSYNVYRTATVGGVAMGTVMISNVTTSSDSDALGAGGDDFGSGLGNLISVEREGVSYTYQVAAVNSNKVEGMMSTATSAIADTQDPTVIAAACTVNGSAYDIADGSAKGDTITVDYSEPMNTATVETGTYGGILAGSVAFDYDTAIDRLTISYDTNICAAGTVVAPATAADIAGNVIDAGANSSAF